MRLYTQRCPSLALLLVLVVHAAQGTFITNDTSDLSLSTYEYIVIGGGTVGLAVANRLAVNHSVLVVERGPDLSDSDVINNPFTPFGTPSPCHFSMAGAPQVGSNGVRSLPLTYGSCLGGGSSINAMMGARPTFAGMGAVEALGNPGWGWDDFLPYMQRSETFTPPDPTQLAEGANYIAAVHGFDGPVGVSFARPFVAPEMQDAAKTTVQSAFDNLVALTRDMGDGFSGGHVASFYHHIHFNETVQADRRSSSAWSFLYPQAQQRAGLTVLTGYRVNSLVTLKKRGGEVTATGVLVQPTIGGGTIVFNISKEVVISSGALYSPAILQRSGIGNATYLKSLQIEPVLDLPSVGANFQDQILLTNVSFPLAASANNTNVTGGADVLLGIVVSHPTARDALGTDGAAAIDASLRNISAERATYVGGVVNPQSFTTQARLIADAYKIDHPFFEIFFNPTSKALEVWAQSILPISRGFIRINTTDPSVDPIADAQYLTQDVDIQVAVAAARRIAQIATTPPFSDLLAPGALAESGVPDMNATDDEVRDWVLSTYTPGIHFVASNSMMPKELGGVVSPQLLVYGTTNIRVVDASVVPLSVFTHTTLGLYGVAEKAAEAMLMQN